LDAQQIVWLEKLVQTSKILFASSHCLREASAVEFVYQLKTGSYFGPKFRLGVSDPRAQATLDLRPLNDAEGVGPCREATSSVIGNQLLQR